MTIVLRYLWLFPFTIHFAYALATFRYFPDFVGHNSDAMSGRTLFIVEWALIVLLSNGALIYMVHRLPKFNNRILAVPNKDYWLKSEETKQLLIQKLQGMLESILVMSNIFFLGIYQFLYQTNVQIVALKLPSVVIFSAFIAVPMVLAFVQVFTIHRRLKKGN